MRQRTAFTKTLVSKNLEATGVKGSVLMSFLMVFLLSKKRRYCKSRMHLGLRMIPTDLRPSSWNSRRCINSSLSHDSLESLCIGVLSVFIDAHRCRAELCHRKDDKQGNRDCELHLFPLLYDGVNALKLHFSVCNSSKEITHQVEVSRGKNFKKIFKKFFVR